MRAKRPSEARATGERALASPRKDAAAEKPRPCEFPLARRARRCVRPEGAFQIPRRRHYQRARRTRCVAAARSRAARTSTATATRASAGALRGGNRRIAVARRVRRERRAMIAHGLKIRSRGGLRMAWRKMAARTWIISPFPRHRVYVEPFWRRRKRALAQADACAEVYNDLDGRRKSLPRAARFRTRRSSSLELTLLAQGWPVTNALATKLNWRGGCSSLSSGVRIVGLEQSGRWTAGSWP